ncbi:MAG: disulfide bond formation protein B [Pseudomonadota bacterium]
MTIRAEAKAASLIMMAAMISLASRFSLTEQALAASFGASAMLLAGAHLFERVGGLVPCILCLDQREAHWTALGVAFAGLMVARLLNSRLGAAAAVGAAALVYAVSAGLAFYHTGVEYKFWPGPAICAPSTGGVDIGSITSALTQKADAPSCEDVQWRFLGVSMAGYNLLVSAGLFAFTLAAAIAETRRARRTRGAANLRKEPQ